jgi:hypothetical protein
MMSAMCGIRDYAPSGLGDTNIDQITGLHPVLTDYAPSGQRT